MFIEQSAQAMQASPVLAGKCNRVFVVTAGTKLLPAGTACVGYAHDGNQRRRLRS